jgi:hypothetical protein
VTKVTSQAQLISVFDTFNQNTVHTRSNAGSCNPNYNLFFYNSKIRKN